MAYAFVSYSEKDNVDGDINAFVEKLSRRVRQMFGQNPEMAFGRNEDGGGLDEALRKRIRGASVFLPIFSDNYASQASTAWAEMVFARNLVGPDSATKRSKDIIKPILYRIPGTSATRWSELLNASFDCFDLTDSYRPARWEERAFDDELQRLAGLIGKALFGVRPDALPRAAESGKTRDDTLKVLKELQQLVENSSSDNVFVDELNYNIINEVKEEVRSASNPKYSQDLSLGRSFIVRAKAIFGSARSVVAVSLDTSSDFWTGDNTRDLAVEYTRAQPKQTVRLFVFSSPQSMLMHRWVLAEHHNQYGRSGGKVLFTSFTRWQTYLNRKDVKNLPDLPSLSEDFGILDYAPGGKHVVARLSANELSFQESPASKFMNAFSDQVNGHFVRRPHPDGDSFAIVIEDQPTFWRWEDVYGTRGEDASWLRCVADVFDGDIDFGPSYKAAVMHSVFFNPTAESRAPTRGVNEYANFETFIKGAIFELVNLRSGDEQLVKSIWFGRFADEVDVAANDPIHQNRLTMDPSVWKYCLSMTFKDQTKLKEFYEHPQHSDIRRRIYEFLDPNVVPLYQALKSVENPGFGDAIERIVRKYLLRMDYVIPDPYFIYRAVAAPRFAELEAKT